MSSATAWNVRGVGRETRAFAEEAARRAGMSLGDWLDEVVADKAAEQGVEPDDLNRDDRLDAIGERIARLARRDGRSGETMRSTRDYARRRPEPREPDRDDPRHRPQPREPDREETYRADALLEAAIARLESRAERAEARAARTFESVTQWMEKSQNERGEERATLKAVADKLLAIDQRTARQQSLLIEAPRRLESRIDEAERELDARMSALARRLDAVHERSREPAPAPPPPPERPRLDIRDAASQIARRRGALDKRARIPEAAPPPKPSWRNFGVDETPPSRPRAPAAPASEPSPSTAPSSLDTLRTEILALTQRIDQMRSDQSDRSEQRVGDVQALRAEVAAMSRSLADLAPRNAVVALEGAMRDLGDRIASVRDTGGRETLVAPLEALLGQVRDTLRAHDPQAAVIGLQREIRAIETKIDAIAGGAINPEVFELIRAQTGEVRNLLAAAAMRPVPVERLEKQIGELADRVERLALNPTPQAESARVVAMLADARAQIERSTPAAALSAIERRLEQLAQRMDQALQRPQAPPTVEPRGFEELARRIDGVRATIEQQSGVRPDAARLEAALRELSQKLDRPALAATPEGLTAMIEDLGARIDRRAAPTLDITPLEQALRALGERPIEIDTAPIENLMRDLGAKLAAPSAIDTRPFEAMLREINQKLDRGATASAAAGEVAALVRDLGDRLAAPAPVDTRPFEAMLREINQKLDRGAAGSPGAAEIAALIRDVGARLDQRIGAAIDMRPLEDKLRALGERIDHRQTTTIDPAFVEQTAELLAERLERRDHGRVDADALANQISDIHDRLDALQAEGSTSGALEKKVSDLVVELDATRRALQSMPPSRAHDDDEIADGLADIRADQASADKRMQTRLTALQDILEKLVGRLGRIEDEVARVDEASRSNRPNAPIAPPKVSPPARSEALGATMRDIPDRAAPSASVAPPPGRPIEGADFLLEPGSSTGRLRAPDVDPAPPKTAVNAHIAAARRAAQAALADSSGRDRRPKPPVGEPSETGERAPDDLAVQAKAFLAARRRPLLLGATLLVAIATLAIIELRGGHAPLMQKSELESPAKVSTAPSVVNPGANGVGIDTSPVGSIGAAPSPPKIAARPAPTDLVAAMPAALPQGLHDAAAAGDVNAQFELGLRLIEGRGVAKDPHAAAQWLEQAAAHDLPIAQYRLGALYEKGIGVARDSQLAMSWYGKAATAGNARAMHNLAVMNAEAAASGKPDYAEAAQWFRKAGQLGVRDSQFNLGILYARGMGVPQDLTQAWVWFSLAAQQGDADAGKKRDEVAAKMDAQALVAAAKALAAFQLGTPSAAANEPTAPPGGWDAKSAAPQSTQGPAAHGGTVL